MLRLWKMHTLNNNLPPTRPTGCTPPPNWPNQKSIIIDPLSWWLAGQALIRSKYFVPTFGGLFRLTLSSFCWSCFCRKWKKTLFATARRWWGWGRAENSFLGKILSLCCNFLVDLPLSFFLWIVATRGTKRFQRTDDVFRIDKVYIRTMNNLESDMTRL